MEQWREVWRRGFAPLAPKSGLEFLRDVLRADDPRLIQGETVNEHGACAVGCLFWQGQPEISEDFVLDCFGDCLCEVDEKFETTSAPGRFLNWYDSGDFSEIKRDLLQEVEYCISHGIYESEGSDE